MSFGSFIDEAFLLLVVVWQVGLLIVNPHHSMVEKKLVYLLLAFAVGLSTAA